ncbi:117acc3b-a04c-4914-b042-c7bcbd5961e8 [Sclerotinia trifoliorum]|uniref:117acc3b-a04c-4914-b042-c7bcbd5961e8 n=1 Tax=Sclerotinia trifoliorum TaxID=28548 RepID=A0A8H2VWX7_9HELO|nr:117acc3b-a04c-4914-b042-c7bcbd5961e8 [Sclerotinia trifoliorum]
MPRTRSRHATRISRRSPPHEPHVGNSIRPGLKKKDLCVGCIVWLPAKLESDESLVCSRGESCCNGKKLDDDGYNHPVVILCYEGTICSIAMITSKTRKKYHVATRIPISQKPQDMDDVDPEVKLYLEIGEMNKQSFIIIEHLFPIPLSMLRSISFKPDSRAFDTRLCKQSSIDLANMFNLNETRVKWVDTVIVKAKEANIAERRQRRQKVKRVTFSDPWEEIRGNTTEANLTTPNQRSQSEPTSSVTSIPTFPATRDPQTQTTPSEPFTREWFTYDHATDRYIQRELTAERQSLLQHPSPFPNNPSPVQQSWHQQYHTVTPSRPPRSNYHATLPSVERYDRSHWESRIRNSNTRTRDLERGRAHSVGDGGEGGCNGGFFVQIVVVFLGVVGFIGWLYGK